MKKKLRSIKFGEETWKWVVESVNGCITKEVRIYDPNKKMYRFKPEDISNKITYQDSLSNDANYSITPAMIKNKIGEILNSELKNSLLNFIEKLSNYQSFELDKEKNFNDFMSGKITIDELEKKYGIK